MVGGNEPGGDVVFFLRMNVSEIGLTCILILLVNVASKIECMYRIIWSIYI